VRDGLRFYKVVCDQMVVGSLVMGQCLTFDPGKGSHILRIKIDFLTSNTILFELARDGVARFEGEPGGPNLAASIDMFKAERYVKLNRLDPPG
jgi:hypothetical protein